MNTVIPQFLKGVDYMNLHLVLQQESSCQFLCKSVEQIPSLWADSSSRNV